MKALTHLVPNGGHRPELLASATASIPQISIPQHNPQIYKSKKEIIMEYVIGILLLLSFFGLVYYAVRGGNLMMGIFVMAIIWTVLPMLGNLLVKIELGIIVGSVYQRFQH